MWQTACLVVNPITVNNIAALFYYTPASRASDLMKAPAWNLSMKLVGARCSVFGRAHRGSTVGFLLLQRFSVGHAVGYSSCFVSVFLIYMLFWCIDELEILHADRITCRARVVITWNRFKHPLTQLYITDRSKAVLLWWFILIVTVRLLSVCLWQFVHFLFMIAWWPFSGKELSSWLSTLAVYILCRLNCRCPFPIWCLGQDVEFDCIDSWSLPFHLLFN